MAVVFFDASGIAKRYVNETGTAWANHLIDPPTANWIYLARITGVEVVSAISRRQRQGSISTTDAAKILAQFRSEFANLFHISEVTPGLVNQAMTLVESHALRGQDAVQLAAAFTLQTRCFQIGIGFTLVSADTALNLAATKEGLTVEDPNSHP